MRRANTPQPQPRRRRRRRRPRWNNNLIVVRNAIPDLAADDHLLGIIACNTRRHLVRGGRWFEGARPPRVATSMTMMIAVGKGGFPTYDGGGVPTKRSVTWSADAGGGDHGAGFHAGA